MNKALLNYFEYLRDTSRNLSITADLHRCLINKFSKSIKSEVIEAKEEILKSLIISKDTNEGKVFSSYLMQIKKDLNKQIYLGIGYIVGSMNKKIFGSIVNIPIKSEQEGFLLGKFKYSLDFESISINYDLLTNILPDYFSSEMDDTAQDILHCLKNFEEKIKNKTIDEIKKEIESFFINLKKINKNIVIEEIKKDLSNIEIADIKNKECLINKKEYFYSKNKANFFLSNIPDGISTWKNLSTFCEDINKNDFKSYVLKEFFNNIFNLDDFQKREQQEFINYSEVVDNYIPIDLSKNQKIAINNLLNSRISYVQGPPGTGKSHTISGMALTSFLMNKKVLIVAQKKQALDVVQNKIESAFDKDLNVPLIYFKKEEKVNLKNNLIEICNQDLPEKKDIDLLNLQINKIEDKLKKSLNLLEKKKQSLSKVLNEYANFYEKNEDFIKDKNVKFNNPSYDDSLAENLIGLKTKNDKFIQDIKNIENKYYEFGCLTQLDLININKLENHFNEKFKTESINFKDLIKSKLCSNFLMDWFDLSYRLGLNESIKQKLTDSQFANGIRYDIENLKIDIKNIKQSLFKMYHKKKIYVSLMNKEINSEIQKFGKMLHWNRGDKVLEKMDQIDYVKLLSAYPIWISEVKNIGEILPNEAEMFDLVIVDEASQVNLAEILPIFYRAKNICIVGDHKQLGLNASGLTFSLSKKFDKVIWNKYKPNEISFDEANIRNLTITKASILDLLRSEENTETFKYVMLDEHYRSLPGLMSFNNKSFYEEKLKIMTETPEKSLTTCFSAIKIDGLKENKKNNAEAIEVINIIKYLLEKKITIEKSKELSEKIQLNDFIPKSPTIGIISSVREQVDLIKELLDEFSEEDFKNNRLICGTPEEMQGDEFDIIILSTTTDDDSRNNGHYANENRFNVATSRSKYFTVFVYSNVSKIPIYESYLNHFGYSGKKQAINSNILNWSYLDKKNKTNFEKSLGKFLKEYIKEINKNELIIEMFNNVNSCGQDSIGFVLYNNQNKKYMAIEASGVINEKNKDMVYSEYYLNRLDILEKAGWKIIQTPYHIWYENGILSKSGTKYNKEVDRIKKEINKIIEE